MKEPKAFDELFQSELIPCLQSSERYRLKVRNTYIILFSVLLGGFLFEVITWMLIGIVAIFIILLSYIRVLKSTMDEYEKIYTTSPFKVIATALIDELQFNPRRYLSAKDLPTLELGSSKFDGLNLCEGRYRNINVRCSEIEIRKGESRIHGLIIQCPLKSKNDHHMLITDSFPVFGDLFNAEKGEQAEDGVFFQVSDEKFLPLLKTSAASLRNSLIAYDGFNITVITSQPYPIFKPKVWSSIMNDTSSRTVYENLYRDLDVIAGLDAGLSSYI